PEHPTPGTLSVMSQDYQRKRQQGKRHNQVVLALAHRRILTLHAMIRNGTLYNPQPATKLPTAA
ncbi:hypothetical protein BKH07_13330, partial [Actinomyces naeslundii]